MEKKLSINEKLERAIVAKLVKVLDRAGFVPVQVWNSEEYVPSSNVDEVIQHVFEVDACPTIHFAPKKDRENWGGKGVLVVPGNGCDVISDWHCGDPKFDAAVQKACDSIENIVVKA